jgi:flavin-dependent thymidylate synthase
MKVELIEHLKLSNAVEAARTCYNSFHLGGNYDTPTDNITEADLKLLDRLLHQHHHYSVARHIKYVFRVEGISTKTLLALSRHMVGIDLSVMSSRFCKLDKFGSTYTKTPNTYVNMLLEQHIQEIQELNENYPTSAEDLAMLYPQAMQYDLRMTMNPQSLQHFLDMRYGKESHAHFDIQELASKLLEAVPEAHKFMYVIKKDK